jgi:hypothetical protein
MSTTGSVWTRLKGKLIRPIADAAGDRHSEAKAHLEASTGQTPEDETIKNVEQVVRQRHGDTDGRGPRTQ